MIIHKKTFGKIKYVIRYPKNYDAQKTYPVLMFMHGAGTRGDDIDKLCENPFFAITNKYDDFPFITVAPQCCADTWFDIFEAVTELAKSIFNSEFTDKKHFYAIGASMGGYAVWQMAMSCPELFAAIVPICGGGMYWNVRRLKNISVWAFHGDSDIVVFTEESRKMVNALNQLGNNAKLTVYENCGHDAWSSTYSDKSVFEWLLECTNNNCKISSNEFDNSKIYG